MTTAFLFKGKGYAGSKMKDVFFDDIVVVNGVIGFVDFIGDELIAIVDELGTMHKIRYEDINTAYTLSVCWKNPRNGRDKLKDTKLDLARL